MLNKDHAIKVNYQYDQFGKIRTVEFYLQKHSKRIFFHVDRIIVRENDVIEYKINLDRESDQYNQIIYLYFKNSQVLFLNHRIPIVYGHFKIYFYTILSSLFLIWWLCFSFRFFEQLIYDGMFFWKDAILIPLESETIFMIIGMGILCPMIMVFVFYKNNAYLNISKFLAMKDKNHNNYECHLNIFDSEQRLYFLREPQKNEPIMNQIVQLKAHVRDFYIVPQPIQLPKTAEKINTQGVSKKQKAKLQQHHLDQKMKVYKQLPTKDGFEYQYFFDEGYGDKNHICWQDIRIIVDRDFTLKGMIPKDILTLHYFSHSKELILAHTEDYFYLNPNVFKNWDLNHLRMGFKIVSYATLIFSTIIFIIFVFSVPWDGLILSLMIILFVFMCAVIVFFIKLLGLLKSNKYKLLKNALGLNILDLLRFLLFPKHFQIYSSLPFVNEENQKNWFLIKPKHPEN